MKDATGRKVEVGDVFVFARGVCDSCALGFGVVLKVFPNKLQARVTHKYDKDELAKKLVTLFRPEAIYVCDNEQFPTDQWFLLTAESAS